jgi:hypothetical protein
MSDDLIHTTARAWSSRFSPWEASALTRLKQCNAGFQGILKYRFPRTYPQTGNANSLSRYVPDTVQGSPGVIQVLPAFQNT